MTAPAGRTSALRTIHSELVPNVSYTLERPLGEGGMAIAYLARRHSPTGASQVVMKVTRPETMLREGEMAHTSFRKEAVALGRLNEQIPPNPCVVRLIDTGDLEQQVGNQRVLVPWLALEYVHGGPEGTTLFQRLNFSLRETGFAFDAARAAHAVQCISSGLAAIHEVGVVHRDLSPSNVLCCGFGESELFKIADFGIARAEGVTATFGEVAFGTPGYSAPEQTFEDAVGIGPWSDVFSLAALTFYVLTGEDYFPVKSATDCLLLARSTDGRRRISDCPGLCPELRADHKACEAIDELILEATRVPSSLRPQRAVSLATMLVPWLASRTLSSRSYSRRAESVMGLRGALDPKRWTWDLRYPAGDERLIRSAAWDSDGHCLVATETGLEYWGGDNWVQAASAGGPRPPRIVHRIGPGEWLLADELSNLAFYSSVDRPRPMGAPRLPCEPIALSGDPDDLMVLAGMTPRGPLLQACSAGRWLKPVEVDAQYVAACTRVAEEEWLVVGRSVHGSPFIASFRPLLWELTPLEPPAGRALVAIAAVWERSTGLCAGSLGLVGRYTAETEQRGDLFVSQLPGAPDCSAVALEVGGREWAASRGRLWARDTGLGEPGTETFGCVWEDPSLTEPFVSLFADEGWVMALTVSGAILEGRSSTAAVTRRSP